MTIDLSWIDGAMGLFFDGNTMQWFRIIDNAILGGLTKDELMCTDWQPYHSPKKKKVIEGWIGMIKRPPVGGPHYFTGLFSTQEEFYRNCFTICLGNPIFIHHEYEEE